jgi:hypothetical protein
VSSLVTAGVSVAALLGGAISFVWVRFEVTHHAVKRELKKCEQREIRGRERRAVLTTVIELLWREVDRLTPDSAVLIRGKKLLDDLKIEERLNERNES